MSFQELSHKSHKARKEYNCIWCGGAIQVGEKYDRFTYVMCGDFNSDEYHPECFEAMNKYDWDSENEFQAHSFKRGSIEER